MWYTSLSVDRQRMRLLSWAGEFGAELTAVYWNRCATDLCVFLHAARESVMCDSNDETRSVMSMLVVYMASRYHMATLVVLTVDMV